MKKKLLLVFDLDETLIHATKKDLGRIADFKVGAYHIYKRPKVNDFLKQCFQLFQIAIWSSAEDDYVNEVVKK